MNISLIYTLCDIYPGTCEFHNCGMWLLAIWLLFSAFIAVTLLLIRRRIFNKRYSLIAHYAAKNEFSEVKDAELVFFYLYLNKKADDILFDKVCDEIALRDLVDREYLGRQMNIFFANGMCTISNNSFPFELSSRLSKKIIYTKSPRYYDACGDVIRLDSIESIEVIPAGAKSFGSLLKIRRSGKAYFITQYGGIPLTGPTPICSIGKHGRLSEKLDRA